MATFRHKKTPEPKEAEEEPYIPCCEDCENFTEEYEDHYPTGECHCDENRREFRKRQAAGCPKFDDMYRKRRCDFCASCRRLYYGGDVCLNEKVPAVKLIDDKKAAEKLAKKCPEFKYERRELVQQMRFPWRTR
jgi:hypothetical protein